MLDKAKDIITLEHNPDGYNIGMNCGIAAGQTVMQLLSFNTKIYHVENPKGGVRHSVVGKRPY
jgi:hypothetical protein